MALDKILMRCLRPPPQFAGRIINAFPKGKPVAFIRRSCSLPFSSYSTQSLRFFSHERQCCSLFGLQLWMKEQRISKKFGQRFIHVSPYSSAAAAANQLKMADHKDLELDYPVKHLEIRTCVQLYKEWRRTKRDRVRRRAPEEGVTWVVEYADTLEQLPPGTDKTNHPVILALHGTTGSHSDFGKLIPYMTSQGARVIAPNFPTYELTARTHGVFRHSAEERVEFIKDFLAAIKVPKIDVLLCHSGGIAPAIKLWLDPNGPEIGAFGFFSPMKHRIKRKYDILWSARYFLDAYSTKMGRALFRPLGPHFISLIGSPIKLDNMDDIHNALSAWYYSGYQNLESMLEKVREAAIPVLYVYGEKDSAIEKGIFHEQIGYLGVSKEQVDYYDENSQSIKQFGFQDNDRIRVMAFKSGKHFSHVTHFEQVKDGVVELLQRSRTRAENQVKPS